MRAAVLFCISLALAAFLLSVSAQPPRHENVIIMFNDSACTQHIDTLRIPERNTTRCEEEQSPMGNVSSRFECADRNNNTHMILDLWNTSTTCQGTPLLSFMSTAPAHTCAPVSITFEGQKQTLYGHVECAPPNATSSSLLDAAKSIKTAAAAEHRHAAPATRRPHKSLLSSLFNL